MQGISKDCFRIRNVLYACVFVWMSGLVNAVDFHYEFMTVVSPNADQYLIGQSNMQKIQESMWPQPNQVKYWGPTVSTGQGELDYLFTFSGVSESVFLKFSIESFDFSSSYGAGSAWGSTDGVTYSLLGIAPRSIFLYYEQYLDAKFLGSNQFYLKIILENYNSPTSGYTMAQFCRTDLIRPDWDPPFIISETNVVTVPEPGIWLMTISGLGVIVLCTRKGKLHSSR